MHIRDVADPQVAAGADGAGAQPAGVRHQAEAADRLQAERGGVVRDVSPQELRGPEAVFARGGRDADSASGRDHRAGRQRRGAGNRHGHAAPRTFERPGQHPQQALRHALQRVRGQPLARGGRGRRRRQVSPGFFGQPRHGRQAQGAPDADGQPQPPGGGRPGGRRADAGQAAAVSRSRPPAGRAGLDPRRRGVRRAGAGGRNLEPVATSRLSDRRDRSTSWSTTRSVSPPRRATADPPATAPTSPR